MALRLLFSTCRPALFLCSLCCKLFSSSAAVLQHMSVEHNRQTAILRTSTLLAGSCTLQSKKVHTQTITLQHAQVQPHQEALETASGDAPAQKTPLQAEHVPTTHTPEMQNSCGQENIVTDTQEPLIAQVQLPDHEYAQTPKSNAQPESISCTYDGCDYSSLPGLMNKHVFSKHVMDECKECGKILSRYHMCAHLKTHRHQTQLKCPVEGCGKVFSIKKSLKIHIKRHSGPQIACTSTDCALKFHTKTLLSMHLAKQHSTELRHLCAECGLAFAVRSQLVSHANSHVKGRPFVCDVDGCFFASKLNSGLRHHKLSVHQANPAQCPECGKMLKSEKLISTHYERMHRQQPLKAKFKCHVCNHSYSNATDLRDHLMQHENARRFECDQCKNRYNTKLLLKKHLEKIHLNVKVKCKECGVVVRSKFAFNAHMLRHTGERPYKCPYCDFTFRQTSTRDRHKKNQHKELFALEPKRVKVKHL